MATFEVADGVYGIDIEMFDAGTTAVYLFDGDEPALVDAGTATSAAAIEAGLDECGVPPADLEHLLLSHIHADHSGAAAALADWGKDLDIYIHELTAPHLIDPSDLIESSEAAMGDHFDVIGAQDPVPAERVVAVPEDGVTVETGDHTLEMIYGPGHSPDHFAVWNPERRLLFAAECLGIYFERADSWLPPATLPNFDVDLLGDTIDRLRDLDPAQIVFPHFGVWPNEPEAAFETAERELRRFEDRILELDATHNSREATKRSVAEELVDISPPYDERVESFYASLVTDGFLKYHGEL